jgi:hypothetical protein
VPSIWSSSETDERARRRSLIEVASDGDACVAAPANEWSVGDELHSSRRRLFSIKPSAMAAIRASQSALEDPSAAEMPPVAARARSPRTAHRHRSPAARFTQLEVR